MYRLRQFLRGEGRQPGGITAATGTDLGDERQIVAVRMKRLADQLVGDMRPVKIAGINVIHPSSHRSAEHIQRGIFVLWRTKHARPGKLHRAIAKPFNRPRPKCVRPAFINAAHVDLPHKNDPDLQRVP